MLIYGLSKLHIFIPFDLLTLQRNHVVSKLSNVINKANTTNLGVNYGKQSCYKKYEQSHEKNCINKALNALLPASQLIPVQPAGHLHS